MLISFSNYIHKPSKASKFIHYPTIKLLGGVSKYIQPIARTGSGQNST